MMDGLLRGRLAGFRSNSTRRFFFDCEGVAPAVVTWGSLAAFLRVFVTGTVPTTASIFAALVPFIRAGCFRFNSSFWVLAVGIALVAGAMGRLVVAFLGTLLAVGALAGPRDFRSGVTLLGAAVVVAGAKEEEEEKEDS